MLLDSLFQACAGPVAVRKPGFPSLWRQWRLQDSLQRLVCPTSTTAVRWTIGGNTQGRCQLRRPSTQAMNAHIVKRMDIDNLIMITSIRDIDVVSNPTQVLFRPGFDPHRRYTQPNRASLSLSRANQEPDMFVDKSLN
eukprot:7950587-Pyramimonas_sp.AAC.3